MNATFHFGYFLCRIKLLNLWTEIVLGFLCDQFMHALRFIIRRIPGFRGTRSRMHRMCARYFASRVSESQEQVTRAQALAHQVAELIIADLNLTFPDYPVERHSLIGLVRSKLAEMEHKDGAA
jgi:hypothetical protein